MRRKRVFLCVGFSITVSLGLLHLIFGPLSFLSQVEPRVNENFYEVSRTKPAYTNQSNSKLRLPHDFKLVINNSETCLYKNGTEKDIYLLVLVLTMHKNKNQRQMIRNTWSSPKEIEGKKIVTMFLLGNISDQTLVELVMKENEIHSDILMEDFKDTYANLTLKTIMGMKWATMFCPQAKYVMKTDDDMFVHYGNIIKYLNSLSREKQTNLAVGKLMKGGPIRNKKSKWYMPKELYPSNKYPPFLSGTGYIMSADVVRNTYIQSLNATFLYLEDVFCATLWKQLGVIPINMIEFHHSRVPYSICRYKKIITSHRLSSKQLSMIWTDLKVNKAKC